MKEKPWFDFTPGLVSEPLPGGGLVPAQLPGGGLVHTPLHERFLPRSEKLEKLLRRADRAADSDPYTLLTRFPLPDLP